EDLKRASRPAAWDRHTCRRIVGNRAEADPVALAKPVGQSPGAVMDDSGEIERAGDSCSASNVYPFLASPGSRNAATNLALADCAGKLHRRRCAVQRHVTATQIDFEIVAAGDNYGATCDPLNIPVKLE